MIRASTLVWAFLVALCGYAMFQVKYEVVRLEDELMRVQRQTAESREAIRVLDAEWSFLNEPGRLDQLARRYLDLHPISTAQLGQIDRLPRRPPTPPAAVVAAAPPPVPSLPAAAPRLASTGPGDQR